MSKRKVHVNSEIGKLIRVITHRPDEGIGRISPRHAEELLFDDIVYLPKMQEEHDVFTKVLKTFLGEDNVLEVEQLLFEALSNNEKKKKELLDKVAQYEELPKRDRKLLSKLSNKELTETLITGYCKSKGVILFDPIPNFIFTRDIAVTINDHVVVTKAAKEARHRENLLTRLIFWAHPYFEKMHESGRVINLNDVNIFPPSKMGEQVSIEGGDMMTAHPDFLLVGCSERTTDYAINLLKEELFKKGVVKNVVQINIPSARSCMHIDTLFTQININDVVAYKPFIVDGQGSNVIVHRKDGSAMTYPSVKEFYQKELNANTRFILSGKGESPFQEREQWTDGCNLVALKPGVAITYDRNVKTEEAFQEAGYDTIHALDFLKKVKKGKINPDTLENTIIHLPSGELSRARGGSHCMTCPIERVSL